jgi:hypothetical protein
MKMVNSSTKLQKIWWYDNCQSASKLHAACIVLEIWGSCGKDVYSDLGYNAVWTCKRKIYIINLRLLEIVKRHDMKLNFFAYLIRGTDWAADGDMYGVDCRDRKWSIRCEQARRFFIFPIRRTGLFNSSSSRITSYLVSQVPVMSVCRNNSVWV